jgi:predicted transcriptional regulator
MVSQCGKGLKPQCFKKFKEVSTENINLIKNSNPTEVLSNIDFKINRIDKVIEQVKGSQCEVCSSNFQKKLRKEKRAFQTIVLVEQTSESKKQEQELNISYLVQMVLEPLASPERLKIITSLSEGKKGFSRLAQLTGLRGGHLIYHIKKLLVAGLIAQEDNKGDYIITQKGIEIAKKIALFQQS